MRKPEEIEKNIKQLANAVKQAQLLQSKSLELRAQIMEKKAIVQENIARMRQNLTLLPSINRGQPSFYQHRRIDPF